MAIPGLQVIGIGLQNESIGSDSLYTAFTKAKVNFDTLFTNASPYNTFIGNAGITVAANSTSGAVDITNSGVTSIIAGENIVINQSTGAVTISSTGGGGNGAGGTVTSIGVTPVSSTRLVVTNSPIVSYGNIGIDLAVTGVIAGAYTYPTLSVDQYGRISTISSGASVGTVTSISVSPGAGIQVSGSPITTSGTIGIVNTGVTKLSAGTGISVSSSNGEVTVSTTLSGGTVTSVGISSNALVISGGAITTTGVIAVDLPTIMNIVGSITGGNLLTSGNLSVTSNANVGNLGTAGRVIATGNVTGGNLVTGGALSVTGNATLGNLVTANYFVGNTSALIGPSTSANLTRFPNAIAVVSNTAFSIQQNEPHNIGIMAEGTANASNVLVYGIGVYGVGYTSSATRSGGVVGEGHVSASADTGSAIGVRGYSNDTHSGGLNIGLYGEASGGSSNYALAMQSGNILSVPAQTWTLIDNNATALSINSAGKTGILNVITTDASEGLTASGYATVIGNVTGGNLLTSGKVIFNGAEDLANLAAVSLATTTSYFTTAAAETATLAAGTAGQIKIFSMVGSAGNMVITVANPVWGGAGTITFSAVGQGCTLQYINSKWCCIGNNGGLFA